MSSSSSRASLVFGLLLIVLGGLFLAQEIFDFSLFDWLWPFVVIAVGGLFFVGMFAGGRSASALAIPGSIISTVGLILLLGTVTNHWEVWSYAWALIVAAVGLGIAIHGWWGGQPESQRSGWALMRAGLVMFAIFGAFFEFVIFRSTPISAYLGPLLLIALGVYLLVTRVFNLGGRAPRSVPPASKTVIDGQAQEREAGNGPRP